MLKVDIKVSMSKENKHEINNKLSTMNNSKQLGSILMMVITTNGVVRGHVEFEAVTSEGISAWISIKLFDLCNTR